MAVTFWRVDNAEVFEVAASTPGEGLREIARLLERKAGTGEPVMPISISPFCEKGAKEPYMFTVTVEE